MGAKTVIHEILVLSERRIAITTDFGLILLLVESIMLIKRCIMLMLSRAKKAVGKPHYCTEILCAIGKVSTIHF